MSGGRLGRSVGGPAPDRDQRASPRATGCRGRRCGLRSLRGGPVQQRVRNVATGRPGGDPTNSCAARAGAHRLRRRGPGGVRGRGRPGPRRRATPLPGTGRLAGSEYTVAAQTAFQLDQERAAGIPGRRAPVCPARRRVRSTAQARRSRARRARATRRRRDRDGRRRTGHGGGAGRAVHRPHHRCGRGGSGDAAPWHGARRRTAGDHPAAGPRRGPTPSCRDPAPRAVGGGCAPTVRQARAVRRGAAVPGRRRPHGRAALRPDRHRPDEKRVRDQRTARGCVRRRRRNVP